MLRTLLNEEPKEWESIINNLFPELHLVVEGRKISESMQFYTVNVLYLETMTHEQFCSEFPETAKIIEKINQKQKALEKLLGEM